MWLTISNKITNSYLQDNLQRLAALEHIISSAFRGENIIFSDRNTLKDLLDSTLSLPSKATLKNVLSRYSEFAALESSQIYKIRISDAETNSKKISATEWEIPLLHFASRPVTNSLIMGEDTRDAEAMIHSAKHALKTTKAGFTRVNLTPINGGGSNTPKTLVPIATQKNAFVLVVTDTDKTHPGAQISLTSSRCTDIANSCNWVIEHLALDCFEIENFLPTNLVADSIEQSDAAPELSERLEFYKKTAFAKPGLLKWIDTKEGVKVWRHRDNNKNNQEQAYWKLVENQTGANFHLENCCTGSSDCPKNIQKDCECTQYPSLGSDSLDRFIAHCNKITVQKALERVMTSTNSNEWLSLGSMIASWGIASERIRA